MLNKYDITIGLEIHAELNTKSKVFCGCANAYGAAPNTNCCPVCVGMPGSLPNVNREAVAKTITAGLSVGCTINNVAVFERKNYFYPDLSKSYQISQLVKPICIGGGITLKSGKFIRLNRIHLEEDAGKLLHNEVTQQTQIDYNRGGIPLIEIVTEPDFSCKEEVVEFLEEVRSRLVFSGVADCKMEEGGMRCDVNLSLKPAGAKELGNRTEIKNLNSFKMVARAIEHEANRQADLLANGKRVTTETRKWNDASGKTTAMRNKEQSQDYRYFPDPDIYAVEILGKDVDELGKNMPVLAWQLKERFIKEFGLPEYDASVLTKSKELSNYYLECVALLDKPKVISNWILTDVLKRESFAPAKTLTDIIRMVEGKTITKLVGLDMLDGKVSLTDTHGVTDEQITDILKNLKAEKPNLVLDFNANPQKVLPFIIGQVMKATKGRAKSVTIERLTEEIFK